jgi:hypothetical protein
MAPGFFGCRFIFSYGQLDPSIELVAKLYKTDFLAPPNMGIWSRLGLLPRLTHLSFSSRGFIPLCSHLLELCQSLSVLVSLSAPI